MRRTALLAVAAALAAWACTASSNPRGSERLPEPLAHAGSTSDGSAELASAEEPRDEGADGAEADGAPAGDEPRERPPVVARIGDREVDVGEFLAFANHVEPQQVRDLLDRMVAAELVESEARRLGVRVSAGEVDRAFETTLDELEADLRQRASGLDLDTWISTSLGLDPARYKRRLRGEVVRQFLAERVVRAFSMTHERAQARVIVTESRKEIDAIAEEVRGGADFGALARERSVDSSGPEGGRMPPILRSQSVLSRLAFDTAVGELGGPIQERGRWLLLLVERFDQPLTGPWSVVGAEVERSLDELPMSNLEFLQWMTETRAAVGVDYGPLFELIGEPRRPER